MKKSFLFLFFVTCNLFALDDISIPYSFSPKDTIKASKFEANNSEIQTKFNKLNDSLELSFIRFSDLESGDSLLDKVRVDTLRVDNIRSNPNVDSISGDVRFTGAPTVNGVLTASGGVSGGTVSGSTGTFSSTVSVDSIYSAKGINSAKRITGTDLQVSDSVRGVTGTFSSRITGTDLQVSDSVRGVTGTFSGALSGLSLTLSSDATIGGKLNVGSIPAYSSSATTYLTSNSGIISSRTASQVLSDIGAQTNIAGTANRVLKIQSDGTGVTESIISDDGNLATCEGRLHVRGTPTFIGNTTRLLSITDLSAVAQGVGGGIDFQGKYNTSGDNTTFCGIKGVKANSTNGNYSGELHFQTRKHGSSPVTHWIIDENGNMKGDGKILGNGSTRLFLGFDTVDGTDDKYSVLTAASDWDKNRSGAVVVYGNEHAEAGLVRISAGNGNGTKTGAIYLDGKAYFDTRPANDYYWQMAFGARHTSNVSNNSWLLMNNAYYNSGWKYRESDGASLISLGSGTIDLRVAGTGTVDGTLTWNTALHADSTGKVGIGTTSPDSTITVSGSGNVTGNLRCGKINTGLGNFEIGQDLQTTDAVTFSKASADTFRASKRIVSDSVYTRVSKVDSIQIGTSNAFSLYDGWYKEGSFACTLKTDVVTEQQISSISYIKIGNKVTLKIPYFSGTSKNTTLALYCIIPSNIKPVSGPREGNIIVVNNGVIENKGSYSLNEWTDFIGFYTETGPFISSGTKGIGSVSGGFQTIEYTIN